MEYKVFLSTLVKIWDACHVTPPSMEYSKGILVSFIFIVKVLSLYIMPVMTGVEIYETTGVSILDHDPLLIVTV